MTSGPWKPIRLESYAQYITDIDIRSQVSQKLDVNLSASFAVSGLLETSSLSLSFKLRNSDGSLLKDLDGIPLNESGCAKVTWDWPPGKLKLWYPVGYGEPTLYTAEVALLNEVRACFFPYPVRSVLMLSHARRRVNC
jgi:beta-mannosidase